MSLTSCESKGKNYSSLNYQDLKTKVGMRKAQNKHVILDST